MLENSTTQQFCNTLKIFMKEHLHPPRKRVLYQISTEYQRKANKRFSLAIYFEKAFDDKQCKRIYAYAIRSAPACLLGCAQTRREQGKPCSPKPPLASAARSCGTLKSARA